MAETLAVKYRPRTFDEVCEQSSVRKILQHQIETNTVKNAYLFCGSAGCGKAQPLYSKVLTPDGYIRMGDIQVGQKVFTRKGDVSQVTGVYPQGVRPIYEITLQDKTKIRVADNHLNSVYVYNSKKKVREYYTLTTLELIEFFAKSKQKIRIDTPVIDFPHKDVLVDPYLLGALIGDGSLSGNLRFSNSEQDVLSKIDNLLNINYGMRLKHVSGYDYDIRYNLPTGHNGNRGDKGQHALYRNYDVLSTLKGQLDYYGLLCKSTEKHIPTEYLLNDYSTRIMLLRGLYDTDGYTDSRGVTTFNTSSKTLSEDFSFLVRSLGIRDTVSIKIPTYTHLGKKKKGAVSYSHYLHMPIGVLPCTSIKHLDRCKNRQCEPIRNIVSIEPVGEEECQCIMVDNDDHTYISDDFIPTHNTTIGRIFANEINHGQGEPIEIDSASNNSVDNVRQIIQQAKTQSLDSEYRIWLLDEAHAFSNNAWQAFLKLLEEPPKHSIFIFCTTNPEKIPNTILSRVQRYDFKKLSQKAIVDRLKYIIDCENGVKSASAEEDRETIPQEAQEANEDGFGELDLPFHIE